MVSQHYEAVLTLLPYIKSHIVESKTKRQYCWDISRTSETTLGEQILDSGVTALSKYSQAVLYILANLPEPAGTLDDATDLAGWVEAVSEISKQAEKEVDGLKVEVGKGYLGNFAEVTTSNCPASEGNKAITSGRWSSVRDYTKDYTLLETIPKRSIAIETVYEYPRGL